MTRCDDPAIHLNHSALEKTDSPPGLYGWPPGVVDVTPHTATMQNGPPPTDASGDVFPEGKRPVSVTETNGILPASINVAFVNVAWHSLLLRSDHTTTGPPVTLADWRGWLEYTPTVASSQSLMEDVCGTPAWGMALGTVVNDGNATFHTSRNQTATAVRSADVNTRYHTINCARSNPRPVLPMNQAVEDDSGTIPVHWYPPLSSRALILHVD